MPLIDVKQIGPGSNGLVLRTLSGVPTWDAFLHAATHVDGGADELDGDTLDITWNPTNYTPDATPSEANDVDDLTAHLAGIDTVLGNISGNFAAFFATNGNDTFGNYAGDIIASNGTDYITGFVPTRAVSISSLGVVMIPGATDTGLDIDFSCDYGAAGENFANHSGVDTASTYDVTADIITSIDLISIFGSVAGGDFFGIEIDHNATGQNIFYIGAFVIYSV